MAIKQAGSPAPLVARRAMRPEPPAPQPESVETVPITHEEHSDSSTQVESSKRRMPESLRRYLLRVQGGKFYLPAAYRIVWFRDECPDWGVTTQLIEGGHEAGFATVQATIFNPEGRIISSGLKTESKQDFPAGWVEKAETGSVARALALAGFGTQFSPELDEEHFADSPQPVSGGKARRAPPTAINRDEGDRRSAPAAPQVGGVWEGPGQCPRCHAPEGKRHGRPCIGA